ncbi:Ribonuclease P protein component [hydrothermal vent metagenome]|uniref:Ribonuclease P protein component n=1 Tax=hydrothermal vent metagenome TaxID=652676 RepID=A0A3B0WI61_9ZZZZ
MEQFPKGKRLLTRLDYSRVFSGSIRIHNKAFTLLIHYNNDSSCSKIGLVISKKVHKTAVQRNRIKRLIRETFRTNKQLKRADYVVMAKPGSAAFSNTELLTLINDLWSQTEKNK